MRADRQPIVFLVVLVLLCLAAIIIAIGVFHLSEQSTGIGVLAMLMFGRWHIYQHVVRATEHASNRNNAGGERSTASKKPSKAFQHVK